jgi:hypothetical protein
MAQCQPKVDLSASGSSIFRRAEGEKRENTGASVCIEGVLADSQQAVMRPTVCNAVRQLEAGLNLREEIVEGKTPEGLFQFGFVVYKAVLAFGSNIAIWFRRVLP